MPIYDGVGGGWKNPDDGVIKKLLDTSRTIAVVGMSSNPDRPSYGVSEFLISAGYNVIPVNPKEKEILGQRSYPDLKSIPDKIDIVDVFRKPDAAPEIVKEAVEIGASAVWLQESVLSYDAFATGEKAGLTMIMDRCIFKEYHRLFG